jgi:dTMP kinase
MVFIVIEGLDGCGGETQTKLLEKYLRKNNIPHKIFSSPNYNTPTGKRIKSYLKQKIELSPEDAFSLFSIDTLLVSKEIEKVREKNVVIMDRYITSTIAYQTARGFDFEKGVEFAESMKYQKPDAVIYIEISPQTSMKRKKKEKGELDYHESRKKYLEKVRKIYHKEMKKNVLGKWYLVDGENSVQDVHEQILGIVKKFL